MYYSSSPENKLNVSFDVEFLDRDKAKQSEAITLFIQSFPHFLISSSPHLSILAFTHFIFSSSPHPLFSLFLHLLISPFKHFSIPSFPHLIIQPFTQTLNSYKNLKVKPILINSLNCVRGPEPILVPSSLNNGTFVLSS
jgi:hypothetical protein